MTLIANPISTFPNLAHKTIINQSYIPYSPPFAIASPESIEAVKKRTAKSKDHISYAKESDSNKSKYAAQQQEAICSKVVPEQVLTFLEGKISFS